MFDFNDKVTDTFCEQLVTMKKSGSYYAKFFLIWAAAFVLVYFSVLLCFSHSAMLGIILILIFGIFYGAVKLSQKLFVEYEYIVVNKDMDIDKIIGKSSRKRLVSIKLSEVEEFGEYTDQAKAALKAKKTDVVFNCFESSEKLYYMFFKHSKKGKVLLVASFNERLLEAIKRSVPRISQKF